jgi:phosphoserine phosphatase
MGRQLRAGALGDIAKRIADVGANIESMWQTSGKETISVEMYVDGDAKHVHDSLITAVDDTGLEIAVEHAGSRLPSRRLLVLDADATLGADVGATRFAPCVTRFVRTVQRSGCRVAAIATAQRDETDKLAETLDLDAAAPVHDRGGKSAALDRLAAHFDVPLPQSVAVGDARRSGQLLGEAGMAVGVDTDAARRAAKTGQIDTAYLDSVLYVLGLAHASA